MAGEENNGTIQNMKRKNQLRAVKNSHRQAKALRWKASISVTALFLTLLSLGTQPSIAATPLEPLRTLSAKNLYPNFTPEGSDYAIRQCENKSITFYFNLAKNAKLTVDGKATKTPKLVKKLTVDQLVTFKASLGKISRTWYVRCLPLDFPKLTVKQHQKAPNALYMLSTGQRSNPSRWQIISPYYVILDQRGAPIWYMRGQGTPAIIDRTLEGNILTSAGPEGISPSYAARGEPAFVETNLNGTIVKEHATPYDDPIDGHSLQVLPNGNLLMLTVPIKSGVDLSKSFAQLVPMDVGGGGLEKCDVTNVENASVAYPAIRELSPTGEIIWSWDSWEHLNNSESIIPALTNIDFSGASNCVVDLFHGVTASQSPDGKTILLTARFASATWGIDKSSGLVKWKLGGTPTTKSLEIIGDPYGKYGPRGHHGGVLDSMGRLLLFDNRRDTSETARGVIYQIDTLTMKASYLFGLEPPQKPCTELDGEVICNSYSMGFGQYTANGGTLISWGYKPSNPNVATEYDRSGNPILSILNEGVHNTYMTLTTPYTTWPISKLRTSASSKRKIYPPWDSGLPSNTSPEDTAVSTIK